MQTADVVEAMWPKLVSTEEWNIYQRALDAVSASDAQFLFGGAFAVALYTGMWRDTKDLDLLVLPDEREKIIKAVTDAGFVDYYDQLAYDRGWIHRSFRGGYIVDIIWRMANRRADVDESWFEFATPVSLRDKIYHVVAAEELLWHKCYVVQRERCDWSDVWNILYSVGSDLDWRRVVNRFGEDAELLNGILNVFNWLCPGRVREFPEWLRKQFHLKEPKKSAPIADEQHVRLLDSRPWFAAFRPEAKPTKF